jgi:hypothetical protein
MSDVSFYCEIGNNRTHKIHGLLEIVRPLRRKTRFSCQLHPHIRVRGAAKKELAFFNNHSWTTPMV